MLSQQFRELEADGIVHREVFDEVPPRVEYSLTHDGVALHAALGAPGEWDERRIEQLGLPRRAHAA